MTKTLKISQWGNSAAVRLPVSLLEELDMKVGDLLEMESTPEGLFMRKKKRSIADMSVDEIIAATSPEAVAQGKDINRQLTGRL